MISYYNGSFLEEKDITISPFVGGFEFGKGVFTTLKYENKQFFNLDKHLKRLFNSCKVFEIKWHTINFPVILSELMDRNDLTGSRIKIIVFDENFNKSSMLISCKPFIINRKPRNITIANGKRADQLVYRHKTLSYFHNLHFNHIAQKHGFDDCLYLDCKDRVLESSFANIFFVKDNQIFTPSSKLPLLPGIIRGELLSRGNFHNYQIKEAEIYHKDISKFQSAFLTNSIHGIVAVKRIDDCHFEKPEIEGL